jgi:hypothetical protein
MQTKYSYIKNKNLKKKKKTNNKLGRLRKQKQVDLCEFEASLVSKFHDSWATQRNPVLKNNKYSRTARAIQRNPVSKKKKKKKNQQINKINTKN